MIILRNPYEGIWEKHRSIDDMDMILESRTGGTDYGRLSVLSATAYDEQPLLQKAKEVVWDINHICTWKMMTGWTSI